MVRFEKIIAPMPFLTEIAEKLKMRMPIKRRVVLDFRRKDTIASKTFRRTDTFLRTPGDNGDTNSQNGEDDKNADILDTENREYEYDTERYEIGTVHNLDDDDDDDASFSTKRHRIPILSDITYYLKLLVRKIQEPMYTKHHHEPHFEFSALYERYDL